MTSKQASRQAHEQAVILAQPVDEAFLVRSLSAISEDSLLFWSRHLREDSIVEAGAKLKNRRHSISDSLARCRERDRQAGNTGMTFWVTPDYLVIQSTS